MHQRLFRRFSAVLCAGLFALTLLVGNGVASPLGSATAGIIIHDGSGQRAAGNYRHNLSGATALSSVPDGIIIQGGVIMPDSIIVHD